MKIRNTFALLVLCACILMFPWAISAQDDEQVITIGVVLPFSGPLGTFGIDFAKGAELAVEQMNAELSAAGVNTRFVVASADTGGTPTGAAKAVENVVQSTGAQVIIGPLTTGEVLGAKQFADSNGIVLVAPVSASASAAIPNDNIFRVMYPPDIFSARAFIALATELGYENVAILHLDDPYGNSLADQFSTGFSELNGGTVSVIKYAPNPTDLSSEGAALSAEVATLSTTGVTAVFCICYLDDATKLLQVAQIDPVLSNVGWLGIENLATPVMLEGPGHAEFLKNVRFTAVSNDNTSTPITKLFIESFKERFGTPPMPFTNMSFDAANIAMRTVLMAGNDGDAIKSMLPYVSNYYIGTSVQGYLDENGDQAIAFYGIYTVDPDSLEFIKIGSFDGELNELQLSILP